LSKQANNNAFTAIYKYRRFARKDFQRWRRTQTKIYLLGGDCPMAMKISATDYLDYDESTGSYSKSSEQAVRDDVEKHHWLTVGKTVLKDWRLYVMLIPMIVVFLLWRYFPMYELLECFKSSSNSVLSVADRSYVGFAHFKTLLLGLGASANKNISQEFWQAFRNTFLTSFYGLCFGFPMPIILALFFNEVRSNIVRSVFQVLTYLPKFLSTVVITTLVTLLLKGGSNAYLDAATGISSDVGVVSKFLMLFGLSAETAQKGLLNEPSAFKAIYEISGIWETAGYSSIVFFAAIIAVSPTSYEAAQIDGAGKMAQMRYVVLPSILSTVVIMLITRIGSLLSIGYEKVWLLTTDGNRETARVVSTFAVDYGLDGAMKSVASAAEMMNNIIGMLLVIGANTIARKASDVSLY